MGGTSHTTKSGIALHAKWRRQGSIPPAPNGIASDTDALRTTDLQSTSNADPGALRTSGKRKANDAGRNQVDRKKPKTMSFEKFEQKYPAAIVAAVRRAQAADVEFHFPPLQRERFETFEEFEAYVAEYFAIQFGGYRRRSSLSTRGRNIELRKAFEKARLRADGAGKPFASSLELLPWDSDDIYYRVVYWCIHGCIQKKRGTGQRVMLFTRYTGCLARLTGQLQWERGLDGEKNWFVKLVNEYPVHNHHVSASIYATYNTTAQIVGEAELFQKIAWAAGVGGDPRMLRDIVSRHTGSNYSQRKYDNLLRYWLGGTPVLQSLQGLVEAFAANHGYRCLVVKDANGVLIGMVLQSAYQRAVVRVCGDTLTMDWTHNTNNRGFHQGAIVATTANGTSVPVLDFLCVTQSNKMMETIFSFFIEHNSGVTEKLQSMVIDKDFGEWKTIEKMFPHTVVVLCIFHVLKWFKHVIHQPKYNIELAIRDDVSDCLKNMVYAVSQEALAAQKNRLQDLLSATTNPGHQAFLTYMEVNWYAHSHMWSYAERECTFTAGNTTSNRMESLWCSYKGTLGNRRRLDSCVEAIFQHATMILRREEAALAQFTARTSLHDDADDSVRPVLMELSPYTAKRVQAQWVKYLARRNRFSVLKNNGRGNFTIRFKAVRDVDFTVDTSLWTCSCRSYRKIDLPCRHLMFVALDVLKFPVYPVVAVKSRWRMSEAAKMLPLITRSIAEMEQLRVSIIFGANRSAQVTQGDTTLENSSSSADDEDEVQHPVLRVPAIQSITHVHLAKHEISDSRVLGEMQKRSRFDLALEPALTFATGLSTPDFNDFVNQAAAAMATLVAEWESRRSAQAGEEEVADPADSFRGDATSQCVQGGEIEREEEQAAWRACRASVNMNGEEDEDITEQLDEEDEATGTAATGVHDTSVHGMSNDMNDSLFQGIDSSVMGEVVRRRLIDKHRLITAGPQSSPAVDALLQLSDVEDEVSNTSPQRTQPPSQQQVSVAMPPRGTDPGILTSTTFTLPPEKGRGNRRAPKQQATTPRPLAHIGQANKACPLTVKEHNFMVRYCVPEEALKLQARMPVVLTETTVLRRTATASLRNYMPKSLEQANSVVPQLVLEKLVGALTTQRQIDGAGMFEAETDEDRNVWRPQYFVKVGQTREFPEALVEAISEFYVIKDTIAAYKEDIAWVGGGWEVPVKAQRVPFLQGDADCVEHELDSVSSAIMRTEIKRAYDRNVLATMLAVPDNDKRFVEPGQKTCIPLLEIVGRISYTHKLNDSVVNFALQMLGARHADVVVIDSLNMGKLRVPRATFQATRLVCFPLHQTEKDHWCILLVVRKQNHLRAVGYDPLGSAAGKAFMNEQWDKWCRLLIAAWNTRDQRLLHVRAKEVVDVTEDVTIVPVVGLDSLNVSFNSQPRQPDKTSCGLFCIAKAAGFMDTRDSFISGASIDSLAVKRMRLRLLWLLMCHSTKVVDPEKEIIARELHAKFAVFTP